MERYEPQPGAYIQQPDGTLAPDLNDEAMAARASVAPGTPAEKKKQEVTSHVEK